MLFSFFTWWYGSGWLAAIQDIRKRTVGVTHSFSAAILLRTLFAPWRRITTNPGKGIDAQFRALIDNTMSRLIGFTIRLFVLFTAFLLAVVTAITFTLVAVIWPFLPIAVVYCVVRGVTG